MRRRHVRDFAPHMLQRISAPAILPSHEAQDPKPVNDIHQGVNADPLSVLSHPGAPHSLRRRMAQEIGHSHGNRHLQRTLANLQRQTDQTVQQGSRGSAVESLQQFLIQQGAHISADGIFGPQTRQAVIAFQQSAGLTPDGIVGPQTWARLRGGSQVAGNETQNTNPAAQLVMAKLAEINTLMHQIASSAPQTGSANVTGPITGSTEAVEQPAVHSHDSEDDDSWWGGVTDAASDAWNSVSETAGEAYNTVSQGASDAWDTVTSGAEEAWNTATTAASDAWNTVAEGAEGAWDTVKEVTGMDSLGEKIGEVVNTVKETVEGGIDTVVQGASELARDIWNTADQFGEGLKQQFADEIAAVESFVNDVQKFLEDPEAALRELEKLWNDLKKKADELLGGEDGQPETITGSVEQVTAVGDPTVCHDSPAPTRKLRFNLNLDSQQPSELAAADTINHDAVRGTFSFTSVDTKGDANLAKVPASDFGTTGSRIKIGKLLFTAEHFTDVVNVNGPFLHEVSYDITDRPGRTDVPPSLENVDETNWQKAADDLDPDVHKTSLGAPKREKFWAKDITETHEKFHVADNTDYVSTTVFPTISADLNSREINVPIWMWRDTEIEKQLHAITVDLSKDAVKMVNDYMAAPAGEQRAYGADEPRYRERAKAVREKAKKEGWDQEKKP